MVASRRQGRKFSESPLRSVFVRVAPVKSNDRTTHVELVMDCFWTRVRFPPAPPDIFRRPRRTDSSPAAARLSGLFVFHTFLTPANPGKAHTKNSRQPVRASRVFLFRRRRSCRPRLYAINCSAGTADYSRSGRPDRPACVRQSVCHADTCPKAPRRRTAFVDAR